MIPVYEVYAEALFAASEQLCRTNAVAEELPAVDELLRQCGEQLKDPLISVERKTAALRDALSREIDQLTLELVLLMTTRRHLKHFHATANQFRLLSGHGKTVVRLRVPFLPGQELLEQLKQRLAREKLITCETDQARFQIIEDSGLIGGFIATCDGYQIDTSLRTTLAGITRRI